MEQDAILNELSLEIQLLREQVAGIRIPEAVSIPGETRHYFATELPLVYDSPTSTGVWVDSGSAEFIPPEATRAIAMAWVEDSDGGTGRTTLRARGGGVDRVIASLWEAVDTADSSGGGDVEIPLSGGRFDWSIGVLGAGASAVNVRIELVGYVK